MIEVVESVVTPCSIRILKLFYDYILQFEFDYSRTKITKSLLYLLTNVLHFKSMFKQHYCDNVADNVQPLVSQHQTRKTKRTDSISVVLRSLQVAQNHRNFNFKFSKNSLFIVR